MIFSLALAARALRAPSCRWLARAIRSVRKALSSRSACVMVRGASATYVSGSARVTRVVVALRSSA